MDCDNANNLIMKYMDDTLTESEAGQLGRHIEVCAKCKADFELYSQIMDDFSGVELLDAPEGFENLVMEKIRALPDIGKKLENTIDNLMYTVWGTFSVLFGIGFLGAMNSAAIMEYFYAHPEFSGFAAVLTSVSEYTARFSVNLVNLFNQFMASAAGLAASSRYVLLAAFAVLAVVQYIIHQRGKVEV